MDESGKKMYPWAYMIKIQQILGVKEPFQKMHFTYHMHMQ